MDFYRRWSCWNFGSRPDYPIRTRQSVSNQPPCQARPIYQMILSAWLIDKQISVRVGPLISHASIVSNCGTGRIIALCWRGFITSQKLTDIYLFDLLVSKSHKGHGCWIQYIVTLFCISCIYDMCWNGWATPLYISYIHLFCHMKICVLSKIKLTLTEMNQESCLFTLFNIAKQLAIITVIDISHVEYGAFEWKKMVKQVKTLV